LDFNGLKNHLAHYSRVLLDLGTGDGRYARFLADRNPDWFVIGVDSCRENLRDHSRAKLPNLLFIIASAQELPRELHGLVSHITINFPWGSLLGGLLANDTALMDGLSLIAREKAHIEIFLNGGAMAEQGVDLAEGATRICHNLLTAGWRCGSPISVSMDALQRYPTTWARRLAHGRDPRSMALSGMLR
jgi:hypothetical protein